MWAIWAPCGIPKGTYAFITDWTIYLLHSLSLLSSKNKNKKERHWFSLCRVNTVANVECFLAGSLMELRFTYWPTVPSGLTTWALTTCQQQEVLQDPRLFRFPSSPFSWCYVDVFIHSLLTMGPFPRPCPTSILDPRAAIHRIYQYMAQLLSNDIWRMWQVNIFCHFTALLGNWLIFAKGFLGIIWRSTMARTKQPTNPRIYSELFANSV